MSEYNVAWLAFKASDPGAFDGAILRRSSDAVYLDNRLSLAFAAGWRAGGLAAMQVVSSAHSAQEAKP